MAKLAAEGDLGRSGRAVMQAVGRLKGMKRKFAEHHANEYTKLRVARYWKMVKDTFGERQGRTLHLASDATRAGGKECLFSCAFCPSLLKAAWLPPQVQRLSPPQGGGAPKPPAEPAPKKKAAYNTPKTHNTG